MFSGRERGAVRRPAAPAPMHNIGAVISFFLSNIIVFTLCRNCLDDVDSLRAK